MSAARPRVPTAQVAHLAAPAKINLGLRIVGRRDDGYHLLESVFAPLELADRVRVELREAAESAVELTLRDPGGQLDHDPDPDRNLAVRAARAFLARAGQTAQITISLEKKIPAGAGLGGGSSDAGTVLRALASLWPEALSAEDLADVALGLGADVPFFLDPQPTWVAGIGEELEPFPDLPALQLVLAVPRPALSTVEVFRRFAADHPKLTDAGTGFKIRAARTERASALRRVLRGTVEPGDRPVPEGDFPLQNDLEAAAIALRPEIAGLCDSMRALGARAAAMSGSGPSVYGVFENREAAEAAGRWQGWTDQTEVHVSGTLR